MPCPRRGASVRAASPVGRKQTARSLFLPLRSRKMMPFSHLLLVLFSLFGSQISWLYHFSRATLAAQVQVGGLPMAADASEETCVEVGLALGAQGPPWSEWQSPAETLPWPTLCCGNRVSLPQEGLCPSTASHCPTARRQPVPSWPTGRCRDPPAGPASRRQQQGCLDGCVRVVDFTTKHQSELKTPTETVKTAGFF